MIYNSSVDLVVQKNSLEDTNRELLFLTAHLRVSVSLHLPIPTSPRPRIPASLNYLKSSGLIPYLFNLS